MSNSLAVAATTAALRNLLLEKVPALDATLSDLDVTTQPLDVARKGVTKAQLNLFLYQAVTNVAWRNLDLPNQVRPGETGAPPLALNLHYLVTAYGRGEGDTDAVSHRVLGGAMSVFHDHAVLGRGELRTALADNDLGEQFERVKVTPLGVSVEEMSKLWTMFQTNYRLSTAYEVTVLLIDSRAPVKAPLPVLTRGADDRGVTSQPAILPRITGIGLPRLQPAARLGEDIAIVGTDLGVANTSVRFTSPRLDESIELTPAAGSRGELALHLPEESEDPGALARWVPGLYTVALVVSPPGNPTLVSNELVFALAPRITVDPATAAAGTVNLEITCAPRIAATQRVLLLFGDRQIEPETIDTPLDPAEPSTLTFEIPDVPAGSYVVRLRVDGVDSIPVSYAGNPPLPSFDAAQKVTVT